MLLVKCFVLFEGAIQSRRDEIIMAVSLGTPDPESVARSRLTDMLADVVDPDIQFTIETCSPFQV